MNGRDWDVAKLSQAGRIRRYWAEYRAGVPLRTLCRECNGKDGKSRQWRSL